MQGTHHNPPFHDISPSPCRGFFFVLFDPIHAIRSLYLHTHTHMQATHIRTSDMYSSERIPVIIHSGDRDVMTVLGRRWWSTRTPSTPGGSRKVSRLSPTSHSSTSQLLVHSHIVTVRLTTSPSHFTLRDRTPRTIRTRLIPCACLVLPINAGLRLANGRTGTVARVLLLLMPRRLPLPSSRHRLRGMTTTMTRGMDINETRGGMNLERGRGTGMTTIGGGRGRVDLCLHLLLG